MRTLLLTVLLTAYLAVVSCQLVVEESGGETDTAGQVAVADRRQLNAQRRASRAQDARLDRRQRNQAVRAVI